MSVSLTILGSGSNGNCALFETDNVKLLIDAGFSGRQIIARLASLGRKPEELTAILITHEHTDHTQGLPVLAKRHKIPVYTNRLTAEHLEESSPGLAAWKLFQTGQSFGVGDVMVDSFTVPHDAQDPVGFMLRHNGVNVGFLTDLGCATRLIIDRVKMSHVLVLETNHDMKLLQNDTKRPWSVKQRILSRHGHLSNDAAAEALLQIVHADMRQVYLGHLSRDCNRPELAHKTIATALETAGVRHVKVETTFQDTPCQTIKVEK